MRSATAAPSIRRVETMRSGRSLILGSALAVLWAPAVSGQETAPSGPTSDAPYSIYVSSEGADVVTRIEVDATGWRKAR